MKGVYLLPLPYALAGFVWLGCLTACYVGMRLTLRRSAASIQRALTLCALALVVSFLGSRVFTLHFDYAAKATFEGSTSVIDSSHWHFETWWFFRFSEGVAFICTLIAAVFWFNLRKEPNASPGDLPASVAAPEAREPPRL